MHILHIYYTNSCSTSGDIFKYRQIPTCICWHYSSWPVGKCTLNWIELNFSQGQTRKARQQNRLPTSRCRVFGFCQDRPLSWVSSLLSYRRATFTSQVAFCIYVLDHYEFFERQEEGCKIRLRSISCGVNTDFLNVLPGPLHLSPFEIPSIIEHFDWARYICRD